MENKLSNTATALGNYNDIPTEISTQTLVITMITRLTVSKTTDKMVQSDNNLTYTIVINNETGKNYTSPVITDILDTNLITFVADSVTVDGEKLDTTKYTQDETTGKLTINLPDVETNTKKTVTFQVAKK